MKHLIVATIAVLGLAACGAASDNQDAAADMTTDTATASVLISDGYISAPLKGRDVGAGFFIAENQGEATTITAASSPVAASIELHTHTMDDGVMKMREVDAVELPENGSVVFEPGSYHLMMFGFARDEGQMDAPVTLTLGSGETLTVTLPIRDRE